MARQTKAQESARAAAIEQLREWIKPGDTIYCILRHVSRSGMLRVIDLKHMHRGDLIGIGATAALAMGDAWDRERDGIKATGCGMDMGFALVYDLGRTLFPDGFAPCQEWRPEVGAVLGIRPVDGKSVNVAAFRGKGAGPMRREEVAELVAKGWTFPGGRNGDTSGWDEDGGYALRQRWL